MWKLSKKLKKLRVTVLFLWYSLRIYKFYNIYANKYIEVVNCWVVLQKVGRGYDELRFIVDELRGTAYLIVEYYVKYEVFL